ncbi:myoneurin isoform X2 [Scleropages formosus]|uniref:myoneurin isoform X2 n=1 Tax=Scleropages formosus TaxID=113540 RepID=UPI000878EE03|nr:myoneurin isoform X2 [Scleropages formosus]
MPSPSHGERLLERLRKQRDGDFLCDCTVAIGEARFRAHRNVLAAFSRYFKLSCGAGDACTASLDPEFVNEAAFQKLLDFVYTGDLPLHSGNVSEIYKAAMFLEMAEVVSQCTLLQNNIKVEQLGTITAGDASEAEVTSGPNDSCILEPENSMETTEGDQHQKTTVAETQTPSTKTARPVGRRDRKAKARRDMSNNSPSKDTRQQRGGPRQKREADATDGPGVRAIEPMSVDNGSDLEDEQSLQKSAGKGRPRRSLRNSGRQKENCSSVAHASKLDGEQGDPSTPGGRRPKEKPVCSTCGKTFSESSSLRRHIRIHKGVKPYECQLCGRAFRQGNQLKTHVRTHTGEKPYQCTQCTKGFAQKCQLVFHCRMHHGEEKPYKCEVCGLQFATSSNFKIHTRKHSGEKPYECSSCGKHFAQASTLTYHMRRHTGEKPYVCDTCGKAFAVSSSLITHSRKHTGETPYMCLVCGKGFMSFGELNKHFTSHTGSKRVECEFCGNSYTDVKYLRKHIAKVHKARAREPHLLAARRCHRNEGRG